MSVERPGPRIEIRRAGGGEIVVALGGTLDVRTAGAARRELLEKLEKLDTEKIGLQVESTPAAAEKTIERFGRFDAEGVSGQAMGTLRKADATVVEIRDLMRDAREKVQGLETAEIGQDVRRLISGVEETNAKVRLAAERLSGIDVRELNETLGELRVAVRGLSEALATVRK